MSPITVESAYPAVNGYVHQAGAILKECVYDTLAPVVKAIECDAAELRKPPPLRERCDARPYTRTVRDSYLLPLARDIVREPCALCTRTRERALFRKAQAF